MSDENNPELEEAKDSRPDWLPENFENEEAFVKSYKEIQGSDTRSRQRAAELEQRLAQVEEHYAAAQRPSPEEYEQQLLERYEENPLQTMQWVAQQAASNAVQQTLASTNKQWQSRAETQDHMLAYTADQMLNQKYGDDWGTPENPSYNQKVAEFLQENPDFLTERDTVSPVATAEKLEKVYKMLKADEVLAQVERGEVPQALDMRQQKLQAQTLAGAAGRPAQASDDEEHFARMQRMHQQTYAAHMDAGSR